MFVLIDCFLNLGIDIMSHTINGKAITLRLNSYLYNGETDIHPFSIKSQITVCKSIAL